MVAFVIPTNAAVVFFVRFRGKVGMVCQTHMMHGTR